MADRRAVLPTEIPLSDDGLEEKPFGDGRFACFTTSVLRLPGDIGLCPNLMAKQGMKYGKEPFLLEPFRHLDDLSRRHEIRLYYPVA